MSIGPAQISMSIMTSGEKAAENLNENQTTRETPPLAPPSFRDNCRQMQHCCVMMTFGEHKLLLVFVSGQVVLIATFFPQIDAARREHVHDQPPSRQVSSLLNYVSVLFSRRSGVTSSSF